MPDNFDGIVRNAIKNNDVVGSKKLRLISLAGEFYYRLCPEPTPTEYTAMATTLCDSYAQLKDKHIDNYWVR